MHILSFSSDSLAFFLTQIDVLRGSVNGHLQRCRLEPFSNSALL